MSGSSAYTKRIRWITAAICSAATLMLVASLSSGLAANGFAESKPEAAGLQGSNGIAGSIFRRPTRTPKRKPLTWVLRKQLFWGGGGGGPELMRCKPETQKGRALPVLVELGRVDDLRSVGNLLNLGGLCIFGVPFQDGFTVDMYRPDGKKVDHVAYYPAGSFESLDGKYTIWKMQPGGAGSSYPAQYAVDFDGVPVINLDLWWPAGLAEGRWHLELRTPDGRGLSDDFIVSPFPKIPVVRFSQPPIWRFPNASPLDNPKEKYDLYRSFSEPLKIGDSLRLYGANFTPGSTPLIGLYLFNPNQGMSDLVEQIYTHIHRRGTWNITYTISPSNPPGSYDLIVVLEPSAEAGSEAGDIIHFRIDSWQPCLEPYASRLRAGMHARVIEGQKANPLRSQPTTSGNNILGTIPAGQTLDILDGPGCAEGRVWWNVRAPDGNAGWMAEGDQNERWLIPDN